MDRKWIIGFVVALVLAVVGGVVLGSLGDDDDVDTATGAATSTPPSGTDTDGEETDATGPDDGTDATLPTEPTGTTDPPPAARAVVVDGFVLGWWDGSDWVDATFPSGGEITAPIAAGDLYEFHDATGDRVPEVVSSLSESCFFEENHPFFDGHPGGVGIPDGLVGHPRPVEAIPAAAAHLDTVQAWLDERGIPNTASIDLAVRVDLDGDGKDEVLLEASDIENPDALLGEPEGSYSVVLMRSLDADDNLLVTELGGFAVDADNAAGPDFAGFIEEWRIVGIADANGDGVMEVATSARYYEGKGVALVDARDGTVDELLSSGCGA